MSHNALWQRLVAGYRSWSAEAGALIPEKWRRIMRDRRGTILVDLSQDDIVVSRVVCGTVSQLARFSAADVTSGAVSPASLADLLNDKDDPGHALVRLPGSEVLRKTVVLPLAATRNLREILRYEVQRQSPLEPDRIYFDSRVERLDTAANKLEAELRIFKRSSVEAAVSLCRSIGIEPIAVEFAPAATPGERSFAFGRKASLYLLWRKWSTSVLSAVACGAALAVLAACEIRSDVAANELHARVTSARTRAAVASNLLQRIQVSRERLAFLAREKQAPPLARIVADVTRLLPDGSWIVEFEKNTREIHVRGYSPDASALVEIFEKSPQFRNAHFSAPLVRAEQGHLERFDLAFELGGGKT